MKGSLLRVLSVLLLVSMLAACAPAHRHGTTHRRPGQAATAPAAATAAPTKPAATTPSPAVVQPTAAPGATKLTLWHPYTGATGKAFEQLLYDFNVSHPNVSIVPSYGGTLYTMRDKLLTAIAGNAAPDLSVIDQFWSAELADANAMVRVQDFIDAEPSFNKDDIYDYAWKTATYKDKIWSMPFSTSNEVLYYNKDLFQKAGLDPNKPPKTWDELASMATKLTKDLNGDGKTDQWGLSLVLTADTGSVYDWLIFNWQNGGALFDDAFTKSRFNEQPGVEALQFYIDLVNKLKVVPLAPPPSGFDNGLIAMTIGSTSRLSTNIGLLKDNLGVAPLPMQKKQATGVGGANLAILSNTKNKQAAWEFVKWMNSADVNLQWSMSTGYLPLRKSVVAAAKYQDYLVKEPRAKVILDQMPFAIVRPNIPAYAPGSREIGLAVEEAVFGNKDAKATLDAAAKKVDAMLQGK